MVTDQTTAVVFQEPGRLALSTVVLNSPSPRDCVVEIEFSGISTGTERLLWTGRMPQFPGMGYPLVPGYESVGRILASGSKCTLKPGQRVFVPGAQCFKDVRGLFGGAASRLIVPEARLVPIGDQFEERGTLLALAATAYHALTIDSSQLPDLVVGHGVLGRLLARLIPVLGGRPPTVWDNNSDRRAGATNYPVLLPEDDSWHDYHMICDVSGDASQLDSLILRLASNGTLVLAGFYDKPLSFNFPPAFIREAKMQISAEWQPSDLEAVRDLVEAGKLSLDGLITHRASADDATDAYREAFEDPGCLKMVLNWGHTA